MQAIDNKCPNCMGAIRRIPGTNMGECESCGSRFALPEDAAAAAGGASAEDAGEIDVTEDFNELIADFVRRYEGEDDVEFKCGYGLHSLGGGKKMKRAREYFDIDDDVADDEIYIVLDTTVMGSGKVGFAICDDGWYCNDEDGDVRYLNWEDFAEEDIDRDGGTLDVGGSKFFSNSESSRPLYKLMTSIQDLFN